MSDENIRKLLAIADKIEYAGCTSVQKQYEQDFADACRADIDAERDKVLDNVAAMAKGLDMCGLIHLDTLIKFLEQMRGDTDE